MKTILFFIVLAIVAGAVIFVSILYNFLKLVIKGALKIYKGFCWLCVPKRFVIKGQVVSKVERKCLYYLNNTVLDNNNIDINPIPVEVKETYLKVRNYFGEPFKILQSNGAPPVRVGDDIIMECKKTGWESLYTQII